MIDCSYCKAKGRDCMRVCYSIRLVAFRLFVIWGEMAKYGEGVQLVQIINVQADSLI